ncbi:MAG TPA: hypothetical protein VGR28_00270 [Candidatus Thermoplasmatota archaeon]|jgi:hypothetical protein|nr:hypothetical protein [Candidatus Thermoplasmatota archaeon]
MKLWIPLIATFALLAAAPAADAASFVACAAGNCIVGSAFVGGTSASVTVCVPAGGCQSVGQPLPAEVPTPPSVGCEILIVPVGAFAVVCL